MSVASTSTAGVGAKASSATRWTQLLSVIVCMILIANLQYGWTLFVNPLKDANPTWDLAAIQVALSIFIALETWLTPIQGWIVDVLGPQRGPKLVVSLGGILVALGWIINSKAETLEMLYFGSAIAGIGGGGVYAT